jgi:diguanylate cyclase (GGDEF)-like protein/PAS domain S-box-containing protein
MLNRHIIIYQTLSLVVSLGINLYAWRHRETYGSRAFMAACTAAMIWTTGDIIGRSSATFTGQWTGEVIRYLGIELVPVTIFIFSHQYCGKKISSRRVKYLLILPLLSWLVMITNPWHHLFFRTLTLGVNRAMKVEYGVFFWSAHLPYCYALTLGGFFRVLMEFSRASRHYRKQILLLLVSLCIPFLFNVVAVFEIIPDFNYTPLSFTVFFSITAYAVFRHQFLGSNPIGYETVFQTIRDGVLILDRGDVIRDINPAAARGLGKEPTEVIGILVRDALRDWAAAVQLYDQKPLELGEIEVSLSGSTRFLSIESTPFTTVAGVYAGRIITIRDITNRRQRQLTLEDMAFHDPLTRLANRRKFEEEVERAIAQSGESGQPLALLYFDLNRFKLVNDTLGHEVGDELLKYVAARVASILRKPDILARLGGDEFALLLHNCDERGVALVVERMLDNVRRPFRAGENTLIVELSIGVACYPQEGKNLTELLRHADSAMYRSKQNGGGLYVPDLKFETPASLEMH